MEYQGKDQKKILREDNELGCKTQSSAFGFHQTLGSAAAVFDEAARLSYELRQLWPHVVQFLEQKMHELSLQKRSR